VVGRVAPRAPPHLLEIHFDSPTKVGDFFSPVWRKNETILLAGTI